MKDDNSIPDSIIQELIDFNITRIKQEQKLLNLGIQQDNFYLIQSYAKNIYDLSIKADQLEQLITDEKYKGGGYNDYVKT